MSSRRCCCSATSCAAACATRFAALAAFCSAAPVSCRFFFCMLTATAYAQAGFRVANVQVYSSSGVLQRIWVNAAQHRLARVQRPAVPPAPPPAC